MKDLEASRLLDAAARIGLKAVEMLPPALWSAARTAGLDIVTLNGHVLEVSFNDRLQHETLCYHTQTMDGDLSRMIKANLDGISHVHVAGVPGRRDLDDRSASRGVSTIRRSAARSRIVAPRGKAARRHA